MISGLSPWDSSRDGRHSWPVTPVPLAPTEKSLEFSQKADIQRQPQRGFGTPGGLTPLSQRESVKLPFA